MKVLMLLALTAFLLLPEQARPALQPVRLAQANPAISFAPIYIARVKKLFEEEGLQVELQMTVAAAAALTGKSVEFAALGSNWQVQMTAKGVDALSVAAHGSTMSMNLVMRRAVAEERRVSRLSPLRERLLALKGLTIGITRAGAPQDFYTRWMVKQVGLDPATDLRLLQIGEPELLLAALKKGAIDAFMNSSPSPEMAETGGYGTITIANSLGDIPEFKNFVHTVLIVLRSFTEQHPQTVGRMARALRRANNFIHDEPDATRQLLARFWPKVPPDVLMKGLDATLPGIPRDARMSEEQWRNVTRILVESGVVATAPDAREGKMWTNRFLGD